MTFAGVQRAIWIRCKDAPAHHRQCCCRKDQIISVKQVGSVVVVTDRRTSGTPWPNHRGVLPETAAVGILRYRPGDDSNHRLGVRKILSSFILRVSVVSSSGEGAGRPTGRGEGTYACLNLDATSGTRMESVSSSSPIKSGKGNAISPVAPMFPFRTVFLLTFLDARFALRSPWNTPVGDADLDRVRLDRPSSDLMKVLDGRLPPTCPFGSSCCLVAGDTDRDRVLPTGRESAPRPEALIGLLCSKNDARRGVVIGVFRGLRPIHPGKARGEFMIDMGLCPCTLLSDMGWQLCFLLTNTCAGPFPFDDRFALLTSGEPLFFVGVSDRALGRRPCSNIPAHFSGSGGLRNARHEFVASASCFGLFSAFRESTSCREGRLQLLVCLPGSVCFLPSMS